MRLPSGVMPVDSDGLQDNILSYIHCICTYNVKELATTKSSRAVACIEVSKSIQVCESSLQFFLLRFLGCVDGNFMRSHMLGSRRREAGHSDLPRLRRELVSDSQAAIQTVRHLSKGQPPRSQQSPGPLAIPSDNNPATTPGRSSGTGTS